MTKRRGHNEGSIRHRPDGRWEARISLPDGKRKYLYRQTQKGAREALRDALRDIDIGLDIGSKAQSVSQFLDAWLVDTAKPSVRPSTWKSYESTIRVNIKPKIGRLQLASLTPQHVQALMNDRLKSGLSPNTVTRMRAVLRRALGYAVRWGLVSRNAAALTDAPRVVQTEVEPLSASQVGQLMEAALDDWNGPLFTVAVTTGLRQGELLGLRWEDIDLQAGELRVRHALQHIEKIPTLIEPKTPRSRRTISLSIVTLDALKVQRARQVEKRLILGTRWKGTDPLVFTSTIGAPCNSSNVTHRLQTILQRAGLPRPRFHDLRHCAASLLMAAGEHPRFVMELLGHSQISQTMNTYSHVMPAAMQGAAARMDVVLAASDATG